MIDIPPELPVPPAKPFAEGLVDCGLKRQGFTVSYETTLQGNVIEISARAGATSANLQCIWDATWTEFVRFEDSKQQAAYDAISEARFMPIAQRSARDALANVGLLDGLPTRGDFPSLKDFSAAIEKHCGLCGDEILSVDGDRIIFAPAAGKMETTESGKLSCLMSALTASGENTITFLGNAAAPQAD